MCVCFDPGAASCVRSGDGSEDEHPGQQQSQHAQGGPAHEPTIAPQHTQVTTSFSCLVDIGLQITPGAHSVQSSPCTGLVCSTCHETCLSGNCCRHSCASVFSALQVYRRVCPRGAAPRSHRGKTLVNLPLPSTECGGRGAYISPVS